MTGCAQLIDVVMLTKNSNKPWFRRVLTAIKREIPVHHFIVVDGYSTDGTVDVVKEFFRRQGHSNKDQSPSWVCKVFRYESCRHRVVRVYR